MDGRLTVVLAGRQACFVLRDDFWNVGLVSTPLLKWRNRSLGSFPTFTAAKAPRRHPSR